MGLINTLIGKKIFIDTAPLIYFIEEHPYYSPVLYELFNRPQYQFISSVVTLTEVLVLPLREGNQDLARKYEAILIHSPSIILADINIEIAKITAQLRAEYTLKTPDAIQLATAISYSADYFLTNDKHLKTIKKVKVITLEEL
jgi:predicted nucleic acid-binding protein